MGEILLRVAYNPYKKHLEIKRWDEKHKKYINLADDSSLHSSYENIIMQDDIENILKKIAAKYSIQEISFLGTQNDYADFCHVSQQFCSKLPHLEKSLLNGNEAFNDVKNLNDEINNLIKDYINNGKSGAETIKECMKKVDDINRPEINICFIGNYSAGKSTIINAIIGRNLLLTDDSSETNKIWKIHKISDNSEEKINGEIVSSNNINELIKNAKVSSCKEVNLQLKFNDSILNSTDFDFVLLDTPGEDNRLEDHSQTLEMCLSNQTGSLPVIVTSSDKFESTSFEGLLGKIFKSKENIDLSRGLIVINKAEKATEESKHKNEEIIKKWNSSGFVLPKHVFYLAATYALKHKCPNEKLGTSSDYEFATDMPNVIKLPLYNNAKDDLTNDGTVLYNVGLKSIENEINKFAEKYAYYGKTHQYAKNLTEAINRIKEYDEARENERKEELTKYLNEKADVIIENIGLITKSTLENVWPTDKLAKKELKDKVKINKEKDFKDTLDDYYNQKIRVCESTISKNIEEKLKIIYNEIGNKIKNFDLTGDTLKRLQNVLERKSNIGYKPSEGVKFTKKVFWMTLKLYGKAIDDAEKCKVKILYEIQENITNKINAECEELFDLYAKNKEYCIFDFESNDFITKDLTDKIEQINKIQKNISCYL